MAGGSGGAEPPGHRAKRGVSGRMHSRLGGALREAVQKFFGKKFFSKKNFGGKILAKNFFREKKFFGKKNFG